MEGLLSECFLCETRLGGLSNELQEATFEDPDHINCESTNLFKFYMTDADETYKQRSRDKIKYYFFTSTNFFLCKIVIALKVF